MQLTPNQRIVFEDRYALRNSSGERVEDKPEQMWSRVADAIGDDAGESAQFYDLLNDFKFVPAGRILAGAGAGTEQTFYNCYVIPVEPKQSTLAATPNVGKDSREAIFDTIATMVDIMSRGGGVGINWSTLRPSGSYLNRVSGKSSGPVGWMDVASKAVGEVEQGGSRRGAAMFMLDDWHPDILKFIEAKRDESKITNANVSVAVSNEFMDAVKSDGPWSLRFPDTQDPRYNSDWDGDLRRWEDDGGRVVVYSETSARRLWDSIVASAHSSGEPGLVFLGRYNQRSTGRHAERIISVNPCGEQGLGAYSVCNLGAFNLGKYVEDSKFNWTAFNTDIAVATRFMDNVIDKSFYWDERSRQRQIELRRIGIGVMGLADALILQGIRYGSPEAVQFTEDVFSNLKVGVVGASVALAREKGPATAYVPEVWDRPYLKDEALDRIAGESLRNLFFLTQAPTGTTSELAGASSGIEPLFDLGYWREDRLGKRFVRPPVITRYIRDNQLASAGDDHIPPLPDYVVTANDIPVEEHIAMQAAVQEFVDSSVSKTVNAPNDQTVEEVDKLYMMAYDAGLKGLAYYRDGSRAVQVLNREIREDDVQRIAEENRKLADRIAQLEEEAFTGSKTSEWSRPKTISGATSKLNTSMGTMFLTLNRDESGKPVEVFVNVGKAGSDVMAMGEAVGRLLSIGLQSGIPLSNLAGQLVGVGGTSSFNPGLVHAVGKALSNESDVYSKADPLPAQSPRLVAVTNKTSGQVCPDCKNFSVILEEGCKKCRNCGWSAC